MGSPPVMRDPSPMPWQMNPSWIQKGHLCGNVIYEKAHLAETNLCGAPSTASFRGAWHAQLRQVAHASPAHPCHL
jgi:hypothetical protein